MRTHIIGSGFVTGEHCVTNAALSRIIDTNDEWIRERTGIEQRFYAEDGTSTSDLGLRAAEKALVDAGIAREEIDYIVFATMTPDYYFPGCGGLLQHKLGLRPVPALDIRQQCTGFLYGLQVCDSIIRSGVARTVLLVGAEVHTGFMPWSSWDYLFGRSDVPPTEQERTHYSQFRDRVVLFGDAAGAVVLRATEDESHGIVGFDLHADGGSARELYVPTGGFAYRPYMNEAHLREGRYMPVMNGRAVYRLAVTRMPAAVRELCSKHGWSVDQIDMLIAHQANLRINEAVQRALGLPDDRVYNNIQRYGNTTAATIPIALDECRKSGRVKPGSRVCFVALGAGLTWGAGLMIA